jgi:tetratricopeptide (TPR) repeat protein
MNNKKPKQPGTAANELFDEIEIDEIEIDPISMCEEISTIDEADDKVDWVVLVDENKNKTEDLPAKLPPSTQELMEAEVSIPTRKLVNPLKQKLPEAADSKQRPAEFIDTEWGLSNKFEKPLSEQVRLEKPEIVPYQNNQDVEDVEEIKRILAEIDKMEQQESKKLSKPLPVPEKVNPSQETETKSARQLFPEIDAGQREISKPAGLQPEIEKKRSSNATDEEDVRKILAELEKIEQKELKELKEQKEATKPTKPLVMPAKQKKTAPLNPDDNVDLKRTLAEMSFIEGNESLIQGDRAGAIVHYRDAINYAPDKVDYYIKLSELLAQESGNKQEAEQLLAKAIELSPSNLEFRSRLADLRGETAPVKRGTQKLSAPDQSGAHDTKNELKRGKTSKLGKARFVKSDSITLPKRISLRNQMIIALFFGALLWAAAYIMRGEPVKIDVKLILPADESSMAQDRIAFEWQATGDKYKIEIEENGKLVLERIAIETNYTLLPEDNAQLKPDRRYTWRVIPLNKIGEVLPSIISDSHFKVVPPAKQTVEKPQQTDTSVDFPARLGSRNKKLVKKAR